MRGNYHTHSTWCDGRDTPEQMVRAAIEKGFDFLGFSSHAMLPTEELDWTLTAAKLPGYLSEIRALAEAHASRLRVLCGVEADYVQGGSNPDRATFAHEPAYIIGSVHFVVAPDGAQVPVDHTPALLAEGIRAHFGGCTESFVRAYYQQEREMIATCDFDVVGHPDLVRKFLSSPRAAANDPQVLCLDETAPWYLGELEATADVLAARGLLTEVNTGAISRGWLDDAYPSPVFRALLRARGVPFVLSSDAHATEALDGAFDRFATAENYVFPFS